MKSKFFKKVISAVSAAAMITQVGLVMPLSASAEPVRNDVWSQNFDSYTAPTNTEVITEPGDDSNKILKVNSSASFSMSGFPGTDKDNFNLEMDVNFPVALSTGTADKNANGACFTFGKSGSTSIKVYGPTSGTTVPMGYTYGGGSGQYGKTGNLTMDKWYTFVVNVTDANVGSGTISYTVYDRADYDANGTGATPVMSKTGMGFRNSNLPNQLNITLTGSVTGEYFYIDNLVTYTEEDPEAQNELKAVSFKTTPGETIIPPSGDKETQTLPVELSITGTQGDLTAEECDSITWTYIGTEADDGYVGWNFEDNKSSGTITVQNGVSTYFCVLTATVKKGDKELSAQYKFMINASSTSDASQIYPPAGYPVNLNEYPDSLVGYQVSQGTITDKDPLLAHWASVGSNGARSLSLKKDETTGDKYIEISNVGGPGAAGNSTVAGNTIGLPSQQIIFEFDAKMVAGSSFVFANNTSNNASGKETNVYRSGFEVSFDGSKINSGTTVGNGTAVYTAGDGSVEGISAGTWYKLIVSYDITIQEYYVKVYDETGSTLIGEIQPQKSPDGAAPTILSVGGAFPTDIKNMKVYKPTVSSIQINSAASAIKVPENEGETETLNLSAEMGTSNGLAATGLVNWSFADGEVAGVSIQSTGAQTALVTVSSSASSGEVRVIASKDGVSDEFVINLTSSSNNVAFTKSVSNITIPFEGESAVVEEFTAETRTGEGKPVEGEDTITYRLLDSTKTKDANVKGVTFNNGTITVEAGASPAVVYVYAENAEKISNTVRVNIHGMTFGFGSGEMEEGYTPVTASTVYSDKTGYGFASSEGLTDEGGNVKGSSAYTMKVKVPNGNYKVNITTTSESMTSEAVSGSATGTTKSGNEFNVAVCDGILDLTFAANSSVSTMQISQLAKKTAGTKPAIYSIGDSTTKNSGHYSGYSADKEAQASDPSKWVDEREYASWGNCVTEDMYSDTFASYNNHGMAGRNSASYYNQARLEAVLLAIAPGDYVTINMGINSQAEEPYEQLMEYYYVQGVLQRGGIPVILTHTPQGPVGNYESSNYQNGEFKCTRAGDGRIEFLKSLAEKYDLNLIDVATWGNNYFNSLTTADLDKANTANSINQGYTAPSTVLELVQSWCPDHNHYTKELGSVYAQYIIGELASIANAVKYTRIEASYDENGKMTGLTITTVNEIPETETPAAGTKVMYWKSLSDMVPLKSFQG